MIYAVEIVAGGMIYIPSFIKFHSVIEVILMLLRQEFELVGIA
jgi:hypothetical protein